MSKFRALIYFSEEIETFEKNELTDLENQSTELNSEFKITGFLNFNDGLFFQYIEGPTEELAQLIDNIKRDKRHRIIKILEFDNVESRLFPNWSMKCFFSEIEFIPTIEANVERLIKQAHQINWKDEHAKKIIFRNLVDLAQSIK